MQPDEVSRAAGDAHPSLEERLERGEVIVYPVCPFALPEGTSLVTADGKDNGLRFVDVDEDGHDDVVFSNEQGYSLHLFASMKDGWSRRVLAGRHGDPKALPMIARAGTNNGAWFLHRTYHVLRIPTAAGLTARGVWPMNRSALAMVAFISRRSTIRSSMPFSIRNSER